MDIALVGADTRVEQIMEASVEDDSFRLLPYPYRDYKSIGGVLKKIGDVDGILFTGRFPYYLAKDRMSPFITTDYLEFDESCLMKALYAARNTDVDKISIDTVTRRTVMEVYRELDIPLKHLRAIYLNKETEVRDIVDFHQKNHDSIDRIQIFTCLFTVHERLMERGIRHILINHTQFCIKKGIDSILTKIHFKHSNQLIPAVGIIEIDDYGQVARKIGSDYQLKKLLLKYREMILDFEDRLSAIMYRFEQGTLTFLSTRLMVERYTENYRDFPISFDIYAKFGFTVSIGIGYGANPDMAIQNARSALQLAKETGNTVKIVTEEGKVINLFDENVGGFDLRTTDETVKELSKKTGVGPATLTKIIAYIRRHNLNKMTAYELSKALHITPRSGRRFIANLTEAGYAREVGLEQPVQGRPRKIYEITL